MPQLIVRRIEEKIVRKLKQRAGRRGVSMEEEHRRILRRTLLVKKKKPAMSFKDFLLTVPDFGEDADAYRKNDKPREVDLG